MKERDVHLVPRPAAANGSTAGARGLTHWLIHHAARRAPASLSERLEEEWLADLAARPSTLSRVRFALGCCWATRVIVRDLGVSSAPVASSSTGENVMVGYFYGDSGFFSRRSITFLLVVGLHIAVFFGLMINPKIHKLITEPMQARILQEPRLRELPPVLPPPPVTRAAKLEVPLPEFPSVSDGGAIVDTVPQPVGPTINTDTQTPALVSRVQGGPGSGFPTADEYYPSAAKRMEEEGVSTVRVCVDPKGRLTSDPTTVQTSGSSRLDQGAVQLAKAGSGHYRASTEDGRAVDSCFAFRVRFELRK